MQLRPYQRSAINCLYARLKSGPGNTCIVLPTAAGKTAIMAQVCRDAIEKFKIRVAILTHVKELIEQGSDTLLKFWPEAPIGIYSAGLGMKNGDMPIVVGGVQSIFRNPASIGRRDLILIDECQLLSDNDDSMYGKVLEYMRFASEKCRVVGLTATPYRMGTGMVYGPDRTLNDVCYEISVKELVSQGYLCKVQAKGSAISVGMDDAKIRGGEFIMESITATDEVVDAACKEILKLAVGRKSIIVFCCLVEHATRVRDKLRSLGEDAETIFGETPAKTRSELAEKFRKRELRILVNVNVLSVGFDAPCVDCVVMLRPTMSGGLYYQQIGRSFRIYHEKANALILDFAGNVARHGAVDEITRDGKPRGTPQQKRCPECNAMWPIGTMECDCGYVFAVEKAPRESKHATKASSIDPITGLPIGQEEEEQEIQRPVTGVRYSVHKKKENGSISMKVTYEYGFCQTINEWVCIEHSGLAQDKARRWWFDRCTMLMPDTVDEGVAIGEAGLLSEPEYIIIGKSEDKKYDRVKCVNLQPPRLENTDANFKEVLRSVWDRPPEKPLPGSLEDFIAPSENWSEVLDEHLPAAHQEVDGVPF